MFRQRVQAGVLLVVGLLLVIVAEWLAADTAVPGIALVCVFAVAIVLASREIANLTKDKALVTGPYALATSGITGLVSFYCFEVLLLTPPELPVFATAACSAMLGAMWWHTRGRRTDGATAAGATSLLAFIYLGVMPAYFVAISVAFSPWHMFAVVAVVKAGDIGAYFVGRLVGSRKLNRWLSPGKTWEGSIGGVLIGGAVAVVAMWAIHRWPGVVDGPSDPALIADASLLFAAFAGGVVLGIIGILGDLLASLIKRDAQSKDSGHGVPGFGGILDVVDSTLPAAPVAYWLLVWLS